MTPQESGNELGATYDCKQPGCTNTARSRVGRYSYCDMHRQAREQRVAVPSVSGDGSVAERLSTLQTLAKRCDRLKAKASRLTKDALTAKRESDEAQAEFKKQLAQLGGGE